MNRTMKLFWRIVRQFWSGMEKKNDVIRAFAGEEKQVENEKQRLSDLSQLLEEFLETRYDFRYNQLTEETEFRLQGRTSLPYMPIDQRQLNTLCMDARAAGIACWDRDLCRYIYSTRIASYHPVRLFMDELPKWDGRDRMNDLARRVSDNPLWVSSFHTWMLAMTAQWMGLEGVHANSVAPMLVSSEQGYQKSTLFDFSKLYLV